MPNVKIDCPKCSGRGYIRGFSHVQGGVCFACGGSGGKVYSDAQYRAREKRRAKTAAKREAQRAADEALNQQRQAEAQALIDKYTEDPRIGPRRRRDYAHVYNGWQHAGAEIAQILHQIDTVPGYAEAHPWLLRNLAE